MTNTWSENSQRHLDTCDKSLVLLFNTVLIHRDCSVVSGARGAEEQNRLFREGKSQLQWPESKHNNLPSRAIDVWPYPRPDWNDDVAWLEWGNFVEGVAAGLNIPIEWGGRWRSFKDVPHWQLKREDDER